MKLVKAKENGSGLFVEMSFCFPAWLCAKTVDNEEAKRQVTGRTALEFAVELPQGYDWSIPMAWKQAAIKSGQAYATKVMTVGELKKGEDETMEAWQERLKEGALNRKPVELDAEKAWAFIVSEGRKAGEKLPTATPGAKGGKSVEKALDQMSNEALMAYLAKRGLS